MMAGYDAKSKEYKLWDANKNKISVSRDFKFDESYASPRSEKVKAD